MNSRLVFALWLILALSASVFTQVGITPKQVEYKRSDGVPDHKKTISVVYPEIGGVNKDVKTRIERVLNPWSNFETTLQEESDDMWLSHMSYLVKYNNSGILVVELIRSGAGAYPSEYSKTVVVETSYGNRLSFTDVFTDRLGLLTKVDSAHKAEMQKALLETEDADRSMFENTPKASDQVEEFIVDDNGVTFIYDYGFPHVAKALQPPGRFFFSWKEIAPHIIEYGPLHQLMKKRTSNKPIIPLVELKIGAVLGGVQDGDLINAVAATKAFNYSGRYSLYAPTLPVRSISAELEKERMDDICPDYRAVKTIQRGSKGVGIGDGATWNLTPRKIVKLNPRNRNYREIVKNFLIENGLRSPTVKIDEIYKTDLEGDGQDEVLIRATRYEKFGASAKTGDYSFVMVRKFVGDQVRNILLAGDFITKDQEFSAPHRHEISAIADLNGNGKMEVVVFGEYYEGAWVMAIQMKGKDAIKVLETGCGV